MSVSPKRAIPYLLAAIGLGALLFWPPWSNEPTMFDFDRAGSEWMISGWSAPERDAQGASFVWSDSTRAVLGARLRRSVDRAVWFRCWAYAGAEPQVVTVLVNGRSVGSLRLGAKPGTYGLVVPRSRWRVGDNRIRFDFAHAVRPSDGDRPSRDTRALSAAFDWIRITPLDP